MTTTKEFPVHGQFTKLPVTIEAYRLPAAGEDVPDSFHEWAERVGFIDFECDRDEGMLIPTLEGQMRADPGDWIIKGVKGEFYPCKADIFAMTYAPAMAQDHEYVTFPSEKHVWAVIAAALKNHGLEESVRLNAAMHEVAEAVMRAVYVPDHCKSPDNQERQTSAAPLPLMDVWMAAGGSPDKEPTPELVLQALGEMATMCDQMAAPIGVLQVLEKDGQPHYQVGMFRENFELKVGQSFHFYTARFDHEPVTTQETANDA